MRPRTQWGEEEARVWMPRNPAMPPALIVCELPDDAPFSRVAGALLSSGYSQEGRVPDFIRDGIALRLLVRAP